MWTNYLSLRVFSGPARSNAKLLLPPPDSPGLALRLSLRSLVGGGAANKSADAPAWYLELKLSPLRPSLRLDPADCPRAH
jgi:hypothetical protein